MKIDAKLVKKLRDETGAGILDCKEALQEAEGDLEKAKKILMAKSKAIASKKAKREAREGLIGAYVHHDSRLGVLVEVNCETDFVAGTDEFKNFVNEIALQIAAMTPKVVKVEDLDPKEVEEMRSVYRAEVEKTGKPAHIVDKIVEGKLNKWYQDVVLMEQTYIRDDSKKIKDILTELIGKIGENIVIRRFTIYELGN